jgi:hypothetical protein
MLWGLFGGCDPRHVIQNNKKCTAVVCLTPCTFIITGLELQGRELFQMPSCYLLYVIKLMAEEAWLEKSATQQALLAVYLIPVSCLACSSTVKMDSTSSSKATTFTGQHSIISQKTELFIKPCVPNVLKRRMKRFVRKGVGGRGVVWFERKQDIKDENLSVINCRGNKHTGICN